MSDPRDDGDLADRGSIFQAMRGPNGRTWVIALAVIAFVLLGGISFAIGMQTGPRPTAGSTLPAPVATQAPPRPVPTDTPEAMRLRTCSVASLASNGALSKFSGSVVSASSSKSLFDRSGTKTAPVGSAMRILTAAAAMQTLGGDYTIKTSVVDGSEPGTIVLVGRGDPTLSALPSGSESFYPDAPKLSDLATQAITKYQTAHPGTPITTVVLDSSYWSPLDNWNNDWPASLRTSGTVAPVTALQVDGARQDPTKENSPRASDPISQAGDAFIAALHDADPGGAVAADVSAVTGQALSGATKLGSVQSQSVNLLVTQMLNTGDNTLAEALGRIIAKEGGFDGSAASVAKAIPSALSQFNMPTGQVIADDASGLSAKDAASPFALAQFMIQVRGGKQGLDVVRSALAVSGQSGSLQNGFGGNSADAAGAITGALAEGSNVRTLIGFLEAQDGNAYGIALTATRSGIDDGANDNLDALAAAIYHCGDNLSNN